MTFDPATILDRVTEDLPDSDVVLFTIAGGLERRGAVHRRVQSDEGGTLARHAGRGRRRAVRSIPGLKPLARRDRWRGGAHPLGTRVLDGHDHLGPVEEADGQEPQPRQRRSASGSPPGRRARRADRSRVGVGDRSSDPAGRHAGSAGRPRPAPPPPTGSSRRDQATDELRGAVDGREHEFVGIGLIVGGVAPRPRPSTSTSPVRSATASRLLTGWLVGLGRYAIPVVLVAAGVALVRNGQSSEPAPPGHRLGARRPRRRSASLHVVNGPRRLSATSTRLGRSGGSLGAARRRAAAGAPGPGRRRSSCCVASASAAPLLITQHVAARRWPARTGQGVGRGRPARRARRPPGAARPVVAEQRRRGRRRRRRRHDADAERRQRRVGRCRPRRSTTPAPTSTRSPPSRPRPAAPSRRCRGEPDLGRPRAGSRGVDAAAGLVPPPHRRPDDQPGRGRGARPGARRSRSASTASTRRSSA